METAPSGKTSIGIGAGLLLFWEVALGVGQGKGKLDWIPDGLVAFAMIAPVAYFAYFVLRKYAARYRIVSLVVFILIGALLGYGAWFLTFKAGRKTSTALTTEQGEVITTETPRTPPPKHVNEFTPQEIRAQLEQAGPLERDDVAEQFRHGTVDWTLIFDGDDLVRHRGTDLMTVRFLPVNSPWPKINCPEIKLEGNAYLGRIRSPTRFRVKGVIGDVELNKITLHEVSFEPLPHPSLSSTAAPLPTAKSVLDRIKIRDTPDGAILEVEDLEATPTPTPQPKATESLTLREVLALMKGHTPLQVAKIMAPYTGLWMEAEGEMIHSPLPMGEGCVTTLRLAAEDSSLEVRFGKRWCDELDRLPEKATIKVRGKIEKNSGGPLIISECERL